MPVFAWEMPAEIARALIQLCPKETGFEDWFPTLFELAGVPNARPKDLDGISFAFKLLSGKQTERSFFYREFHSFGGEQAVRVGDWKLIKRKLLATPSQPATPTPRALQSQQ